MRDKCRDNQAVLLSAGGVGASKIRNPIIARLISSLLCSRPMRATLKQADAGGGMNTTSL
jgi:hypothetical protein